MNEKDLKKYIDENNITGKLIGLSLSTKTVEEAEKALGINREDIIKSIVLISSKEEPVIAMVNGNSRVDIKKLQRLWAQKLSWPHR